MKTGFLLILTSTLMAAPLPVNPDDLPLVGKTAEYRPDSLTEFRLYPHLDRAYQALGKKDYLKARRAIEQARDIAPGYALLDQLEVQVNRAQNIRRTILPKIMVAEPKPPPAPNVKSAAKHSLSMRGYQALASGQDRKAAALLAASFFAENTLSCQQQRQIARDLGYLYFKLGEQKTAAHWWQIALTVRYDAETALLAAAALIEAGDAEAAKHQMNMIDRTMLPRQTRIRYHEIAARIAAKIMPGDRLVHLATIADITPSADRYYALGFQQTKAGDLDAARLSFAKARTLDPANPEILGALAYTELSRGNPETAIALFEELAREKPDNATLHAQLGYLYKQVGDRYFARYHFEQAIDYAANAETVEEFQVVADPLRREIAALGRGYSVSSYVFFRRNSLSESGLNAAAQAIGGSQGAFQVAIRPGHYIKALDKIPAELYGRLVWALEDESYAIRRDSMQAGLGIRVQPVKSLNLILAAARLISVGINSRDDWLFRASYSRGRGLGFDSEKSNWFYHNLYADGAVIDPADPDFFGAIEGQAGWAFRLGKKWQAAPHLLASGILQKDDFSTISLVEAGPGITLRYLFGATPYRTATASAEFRLHYRQKLAGSSDNGSGLTLTAAVNY